MAIENMGVIISFLQNYGYFAVFLGVLLEGPLTTMLSAFAASLGVFNIYFVFPTCILAMIALDTIYYAIGRFGRIRRIEKYGRFIGLTRERVIFVERMLKNHARKTIVIIKLAPFAVPTLTVVGAFKVPFKKFFSVSILTNLCVAAILTAIGFYSGVAITSAYNALKFGSWIFLIAIILIIIFLWMLSKLGGDLYGIISDKSKKDLFARVKN